MGDAAAAQARLAEERKIWRKDHPVGFVAKPTTRDDGSVDMFTWKCSFPGLPDTYAEGGQFPCTIKFTAQYPQKPPAVFMPKDFFHVNVFKGGAVCLSILKEVMPEHLGKVPGWSPSYSMRQILIAVQELISNPNFGSIANPDAYDVNRRSPREYTTRMRAQALRYAPKDDE